MGWSNTHAEQRSFHIVAKQKHEKSVERSNAARKFLDSLWTIHGSPADSETKVRYRNPLIRSSHVLLVLGFRV